MLRNSPCTVHKPLRTTHRTGDSALKPKSAFSFKFSGRDSSKRLSGGAAGKSGGAGASSGAKDAGKLIFPFCMSTSTFYILLNGLCVFEFSTAVFTPLLCNCTNHYQSLFVVLSPLTQAALLSPSRKGAKESAAAAGGTQLCFAIVL